MSLRDSLAAVLRLVRALQGVSKDDFHGQLDPKHVYNVENAKVSVTLETLEIIASTLKVDPLTLLTLAASLDRNQSHEELLRCLSHEGERLIELGIAENWSRQFKNGALQSMPAGRRTSPEKIKAIVACRARGMTQKETATQLGIPSSTVNRIWNRASES